MNDLKVTYRKINDLKGYKNNSRTHSDEQVSQVAASINEFGFTNPILIDEKSIIIAGHGRIEAAKKIGLAEVPTIELSGLSDTQKKAYVIADNKLHENGGWNDELLRIEIQGIGDLGFNIDLLGFDDKELSKLFDSTAGIKLEDSLDEKELQQVIIKFQPCDKIEIMNSINNVLTEFKDAHIWVDLDEQV